MIIACIYLLIYFVNSRFIKYVRIYFVKSYIFSELYSNKVFSNACEFSAKNRFTFEKI